MVKWSVPAHRQQTSGEAEGGEYQARLDCDVHNRAGHAVGDDLRNDASQAVDEPRSGAPNAAQQIGALRRDGSLT